MTTSEISIERVAISEDSLERECWVFTEYLLGCAAHAYAIRKYAEAHQVSDVFSAGNRFDFFLVRAARIHWAIAKLADGYARMFAPRALLRRKLVLLLAILETSAPSCHLIDSVEGGNRLALLVRLAARATVSMLSLVAGVMMFLPAQLIFGWRKALKK